MCIFEQMFSGSKRALHATFAAPNSACGRCTCPNSMFWILKWFYWFDIKCEYFTFNAIGQWAGHLEINWLGEGPHIRHNHNHGKVHIVVHCFGSLNKENEMDRINHLNKTNLSEFLGIVARKGHIHQESLQFAGEFESAHVLQLGNHWTFLFNFYMRNK